MAQEPWWDMIILRCGDTATGPVGSRIATLWSLYADKASIAPRLQYLYTLREALNIMLGSLADTVTVSAAGTSMALDQKSKHRQDMLAEVQAEIEKVENQARAGRTPATGTITAVEPVTPQDRDVPPTRVDANDPRYRGDAYWGRGGWTGTAR